MPKRTFVYGAAILLGANLINRVLGFTYQYLIMSNIGGEAYGLFNMVFPVYMMALVLTTAGIPLAVSKMVAEEVSLGRYHQAEHIFKVALILLTISGGIVSILLHLLAPLLANRIFPDARILKVFLICTPAIFIVSVASAFRGYFQGLQNMIPTAVSQICEQIIRVLIGFSSALRLMPLGVEWAAGGLALGMLCGEGIGLLVIILQYKFKKNKNRSLSSLDGGRSNLGVQNIIKRLFEIASPVTAGRFLATGLSTLDAMVIPSRLRAAGYTAREATTMFGSLGGTAFTLLTFPSVFTFALATSLVPAISEAAARKQFQIVRSRSTEAIRLTVLMGIPCLILLFFFAYPLAKIFKSENIAPVLQILAIGGIFSYLQQTTVGILQGLGKAHTPVLHSIIGAIIRIPVIFMLTGMAEWGLAGSALGYVLGFFVVAILNISAIIRHTGMAIDLPHFVLQPLSAGLGMVLILKLLAPINSVFAGWFMLKVLVGVTIYLIILFINGGITYSDLRRIPWLNKLVPR